MDFLYERDKTEATAESTISSSYRPRPIFAAIHSHVTTAMGHLANQISSEDDRFVCEVISVGSAHEGTKIGLCDEFDYNFVLTNLGRRCRVGYSPESPPGFVLLKASTPDYDEDLFNNSGTLNTRIVKFKFEAPVKQVLRSSQFCDTTGLEFIDLGSDDFLPSLNASAKPHTYITLALISPVNGYHVMHCISVDIVPALQINDWWPEDARRQDLCQTGECLIVFTQPQNKTQWIGWTEPHGFISFARAESRLLRECRQVVKAAYMVVKQMSKDDHLFTSHVIKTALLWCLDDDGFSSCLQLSDSECSSYNSDEVKCGELLRLVQKILRRLMCFAAQDYVPSYFMPKCHQPVSPSEIHLKQFHMRLHQQGLTYIDLIGVNDEVASRNQPLEALYRMIVYSHLIYWSVLSDTDELEFFMPSTINPLREIEYQHLPTSLRRQLKLKLCDILCR